LFTVLGVEDAPVELFRAHVAPQDLVTVA
jgi:hypothetical protein